jgi:hypothetical protein
MIINKEQVKVPHEYIRKQNLKGIIIRNTYNVTMLEKLLYLPIYVKRFGRRVKWSDKICKTKPLTEGNKTTSSF